MNQINLEDARTEPKSKVLSGRDRGAFWRKKFNIDQLDINDEQFDVIIPQDVYSVNMSFFLNLFGESVRKLGRDRFIQKYKFICDPILMPSIEKNIDRALKQSDIFNGV